MGRQFRIYVLPADVDALVDDLQRSTGARFFLDKSQTAEPREVSADTVSRSAQVHDGLMGYERCYLASREGAPPAMRHIATQGYWLVDTDSESIEFDGCRYGDDLLIEGRFYYQTDLLTLAGDAIVPKSDDFVRWAERVFRRAKKMLTWDAEVQAYVGDEAARWAQSGGRFSTSFALTRKTASLEEGRKPN